MTMEAPCRRFRASVYITFGLLVTMSVGSITTVRAQGTPTSSPPSGASQGSAAGTPTLQAEKAAMPEVQILIAPMPGAQPGSQWLVSTVYAKKVPQAETEARANRLLQLTGWQAADESFSDRALESAPLKGGKAPILSSLTFRTNGQVVNFTDGTIALEPFLLAYRDLSRVHVTVLSPGPFTFRGLRSYRDDNIEVALNAGQGAWTYIANIKNHRAERFDLPRYHTEQPTTATTKNAGVPKPLLFGGLAVLALVAGGLAFTLVRRLMAN